MPDPHAPAPTPATYAELAQLIQNTTHAEWEATLGQTYASLKHTTNEENHA